VVAFLGINYQHDLGPAVLAHWGLIEPEQLYGGAWWGLFTDAFVHEELIHLMFNLYWLWILGAAFERTFGSLRFLLFVLVSAFVTSGLQEFDGFGFGLSGVGYALFGFGWVGRTRYPAFARYMGQQTVMMFVVWFFLCVALTYAHRWMIGNVAHLTGALFGAALAGLMIVPQYRAALSLALVAMMCGSVAVLFWNPWSGFWLANQADKARDHGQIGKAAQYYMGTLNTGDINPEWTWASLAEMYADHKMPQYRDAYDHLKAIDPGAARQIADYYGDPDPPDSPSGKGVE